MGHANSHVNFHVDSVRRFNRFYTKQIGVLDESLLRSPFSLTELRVLYEIAHRDRPNAAELAEHLHVDRGYLSRMLRRFQKLGLLRRQASAEDGRQSLLSLTDKGRRTFAALDARQQEEVATLIGALPAPQQRRLVDAMSAIEQILGAPPGVAKTPYLLRQHQPGDLGWVVHRHGALYAQEFGYDAHFEALVAKIVGDFVERHDAARERCWIAEKDGEIVGSVFLVKKSATVAKLRLLYVEPRVRGLGIGERLVDECIRFARQARYRRITLWTQSHLAAARHIYEKMGFTLTAEEPHHSYGLDLVSETWELAL
jgi:DNA-binding MarR family transcriptional regulator/N-acetylglutamate synthase-like GNAT family acetyltransferase